jgi:hypothetical protein
MGKEGGTYLRRIQTESFPHTELLYMLEVARGLPTVESVKARTAGKGRLRLIISHRAETFRDL